MKTLTATGIGLTAAMSGAMAQDTATPDSSALGSQVSGETIDILSQEIDTPLTEEQFEEISRQVYEQLSGNERLLVDKLADEFDVEPNLVVRLILAFLLVPCVASLGGLLATSQRIQKQIQELLTDQDRLRKLLMESHEYAMKNKETFLKIFGISICGYFLLEHYGPPAASPDWISSDHELNAERLQAVMGLHERDGGWIYKRLRASEDNLSRRNGRVRFDRMTPEDQADYLEFLRNLQAGTLGEES